MTLMLIKYQSLKKNHEGNTTMSFKINAKQLLKKYNQIWKIVQKLLKIEFDGKPVCGGDDKYIKTKIKIYGGKVNTNFQDKIMPKEKAPCNCLSIIMLDFIIKAKKKYYPQTLLQECKYEQKRLKTENLTDDDLEKRFSDNDYNDEWSFMMNLASNLLKAKKSILITIKA